MRLSVEDNGIGIAPGALSRIFDMFSLIDGAAARSEGGLGIGLALVKGLLDLHGGTIEARSQGLGHGSEFIVHLPFSASAAAGVPAAAAATPPVATMGRRVMVVDDGWAAATHWQFSWSWEDTKYVWLIAGVPRKHSRKHSAPV